MISVQCLYSLFHVYNVVNLLVRLNKPKSLWNIDEKEIKHVADRSGYTKSNPADPGHSFFCCLWCSSLET